MAQHDISALLDATEKKFRLTSIMVDPEARRTSVVPTSILSQDLMMGGGIIPGQWITVYGGEGSCKSTNCATMLGSLASFGVKGGYFDYEGSVDPVYLGALLAALAKLRGGKQMTAEQIFGLPDPKNPQKWKIKPIFRLYGESTGEALFDSMSSLARLLPDKLFVNGKWYYVFTDKPTDMKIDQKLSSRGEYYVQADNGYAEMIIFADSYPMMYPEQLDEDGKGAGMAAVARMFSANIPKLMGKMKKKGITVIGVNQLRLKPGVSYGDPSYEPGGQAVQYASSVRIKTAARSVPHGKGPSEDEASVLSDGDDQYKYVLLKVTKNKAAVSIGLESWQRVWASDPEGRAHGFCPVWNIYDYLVLTGQAERFGSGKKRVINMHLYDEEGDKEIYVNTKLDFMDLKALVLLEGDERKEYAKGLGMTPANYKRVFADNSLYAICAAQVANGTGASFAYAMKNGGVVGEGDADAEPSEDVDDDDTEEGDEGMDD